MCAAGWDLERRQRVHRATCRRSVGSASRNFLISPASPPIGDAGKRVTRGKRAAEARQAAPGADRVMAAVRAAPTLAHAIGDATLVIGTTTGSRRNPGRQLLSLRDLAAWLRPRHPHGCAALLFGSEKTGLSNEDMSHCHALVRIPTTRGSPSIEILGGVLSQVQWNHDQRSNA